MLEVLSLESEQTIEMPAIIKENKIDGLIIIGRLNTEYLKELNEQRKVPMVFLDFYDEHIVCDSVVSDNFYGMYKMTSYLINQGHKEIAFVGEKLATSSIMDRYLGYMKAMLENGIKVNEKWVLPDRDLEKGIMEIKLPKVMPTAFVCNCDLAAEMFIEHLKNAGYDVPGQIPIVGYDNFTYSKFISKNLTTYDVDTTRLAKEAFHILTKRIKKSSDHREMRIVQGQMLIRNSVNSI